MEIWWRFGVGRARVEPMASRLGGLLPSGRQADGGSQAVAVIPNAVPQPRVVAKVRLNEPQKDQQNRHRQCQNLDGAFEVEGDVPAGPALLLDDVIDSGWTLAVVAALLRQAGSGPVFPVALASSAPGD